jgi:hypothetical protein
MPAEEFRSSRTLYRSRSMHVHTIHYDTLDILDRFDRYRFS